MYREGIGYGVWPCRCGTDHDGHCRHTVILMLRSSRGRGWQDREGEGEGSAHTVGALYVQQQQCYGDTDISDVGMVVKRMARVLPHFTAL